MSAMSSPVVVVVDIGVGVELATKRDGPRGGAPLTTISCSPGVPIVLIVSSVADIWSWKMKLQIQRRSRICPRVESDIGAFFRTR